MYLFELQEEFRQAAIVEADKAVGYVLAAQEQCMSYVGDNEKKIFPVTPLFLNVVTNGIQAALLVRFQSSKLKFPEKLISSENLYNEYLELAKDTLRNVRGIKPLFLKPEA